MGSEGWFDQYRRTRRYEKPFMVEYYTFVHHSIHYLMLILFFLQARRRINFEKCKAIYNEDMNRKIQFVLRTNRVNPFPGC